MFKLREFKWVASKIIEFKDNIIKAEKDLELGEIEKGFEELTTMFIEWQK